MTRHYWPTLGHCSKLPSSSPVVYVNSQHSPVQSSRGYKMHSQKGTLLAEMASGRVWHSSLQCAAPTAISECSLLTIWVSRSRFFLCCLPRRRLISDRLQIAMWLNTFLGYETVSDSLRQLADIIRATINVSAIIENITHWRTNIVARSNDDNYPVNINMASIRPMFSCTLLACINRLQLQTG